MLNINTLPQAKATARSLEKALARKGIALQHSQALDVLAAICGRPDWNALTPALAQGAIDAQLSPIELEHALDCEGLDYGPEAMLVAHTGFQLRYSDVTEMCEYVRVCDPLGREVAYWTSVEWQEDSELVMGAILGALVRSRPVPVAQEAAQAARRAQAPSPSIREMSFTDLQAVGLGKHEQYPVHAVDPDVLALLAEPESEQFLAREHDIAVWLHYESDGTDFDEQLSLGQLASLTWDPNRELFVDPDGATYEFIFAVSASEWFSTRHLRKANN